MEDTKAEELEQDHDSGAVSATMVTAPGDKRIYMAQEKFIDIVHKLRSQETRLQAYANLHMLLYEKDQELHEQQELVKQYQTAYTQSQCRIRNLIQTLGLTHASDHQDVDHDAGVQVNIAPVHRESSPALAETHDLQTDGAGADEEDEYGDDEGVQIIVRPRIASHVDDVIVPEDKTQDITVNLRSVELNEPDEVSSDGQTEASKDSPRTLRGRGLESTEDDPSDNNVTVVTGEHDFVTVTTTKTETDDKEHDDVPESKPPTSLPPVIPYITGVSRVVFDNVVKENIKLKKMLQDIIHRKDIQELLNVREYEDVVRLLRMELANKQQKIQSLQADIVAQRGGDTDTLAVKLLSMNEKLEQMDKQMKNKQMILESYKIEYNKLLAEKQQARETCEAQPVQEDGSLPLTSELPSGIPITVATQRLDSITEDETSKGEEQRLQRKLGEITEKYERQINHLKAELSQLQDTNGALLQKCQDQEVHISQSWLSTHSHEISDLSQQNASLLARVSSLEKELKAQKEKESAYNIQMETFLEDFNRERQTWLKRKAHFENQNEILQGHVSKLQRELDKVNKLLLEEQQWRTRTAPSTMVTGGFHGDKIISPWLGHGSHFGDEIVADGPESFMGNTPESKSPGKQLLPQNQPTGRGQADGVEGASQSSLECPRCQAEFKDSKELESHKRRCMDN